MPRKLNPMQIRELVDYDPETGGLFWRSRESHWFAAGKQSAEAYAKGWNKRLAGKAAFANIGKRGYLQGYVSGRFYAAHRVVWCWMHGAWPEGIIDHINGNPADNRISNLRIATRSQNQFNRSSGKGSTSDYCGVHWAKRRSEWVAKIRCDGKVYQLGAFEDEVEAAKAYDEAARRLHGDFAKVNFA